MKRKGRKNEMIKKILGYGFLVILLLVLIGQCSNKEEASTPTNTTPAKQEAPKNTNEITMAEFSKIENGMTLAEVEAIIGGKGELQTTQGDGKYKIEFYSWEGNATLSNANVNFTGGKVSGKTQLGLK